jgi:uncharacterized protein YggE
LTYNKPGTKSSKLLEAGRKLIVSRKTNLKLMVTIVAIALEAIVPAQILAAPSSASANALRLAQLFYPPASDRQIVAVTGQGYASLPADLANIVVSFSNRDSQSREDSIPESSSSKPGKAKPAPLKESDLAPVVSALKAAGIPDQKIKVTVDPLEGRNVRYYSNYGGNATIKIEVEKPTSERIDQLVKVVNGAKSRTAKIFVEGATVQYVLNSCEALENASYLSAMQDAKMRANAVAKAMGVQLTDVPSVAELPFLGRLYSPCSQNRDVTGAIFSRPMSPYSPGAPAEVGIYREIAVTYRVR